MRSVVVLPATLIAVQTASALPNSRLFGRIRNSIPSGSRNSHTALVDPARDSERLAIAEGCSGDRTTTCLVVADLVYAERELNERDVDDSPMNELSGS